MDVVKTRQTLIRSVLKIDTNVILWDRVFDMKTLLYLITTTYVFGTIVVTN